jgi:TusA-related sulfurtransferase
MKGLKCPMPIIKLGAAIRQIAVGEEVRVVADDKGFSPDVRAWSDKTGHELVSLDESDPNNLVAVVRRTK